MSELLFVLEDGKAVGLTATGWIAGVSLVWTLISLGFGLAANPEEDPVDVFGYSTLATVVFLMLGLMAWGLVAWLGSKLFVIILGVALPILAAYAGVYIGRKR